MTRRAAVLVVAVVVVGGCGGSRSGSSGTTVTLAPAARPPATLSARAFAGLVNAVCRTVRAGAPAALAAGASDAAIRAHAEHGVDAARRTLTAFDRLQAPTTSLVRLRPLDAEYVRLRGLYQTVLLPGAPAPHTFGAAIQRQEARTAAAALAVGVGACAPQTASR